MRSLDIRVRMFVPAFFFFFFFFSLPYFLEVTQVSQTEGGRH